MTDMFISSKTSNVPLNAGTRMRGTISMEDSGAVLASGLALSEVTTNVTRRIALVVEDDPLLQRAMAKLLEKAKFEVLTALHFNAAVFHLNAVKFDLACVDLGLPSKSGYELCEHIRSRPHLASLPILVTSERSFPEDMAHAEEAGANAFLKKPFPMDRLLKYVSALLDGPHCSRPSVCRLSLAPVAHEISVA
jgi:two-component system, OmpR family, phosphate regulon response regulator PhoB